jgi:hypothetical protein
MGPRQISKYVPMAAVIQASFRSRFSLYHSISRLYERDGREHSIVISHIALDRTSLFSRMNKKYIVSGQCHQNPVIPIESMGQ